MSFQTINLFDPNYLFVCYRISKIPTIFFNINNSSYLFSIIPLIVQIFALLFYIEFFEYNFCNLNQNTKKNILLREKKEKDEQDKNDDIIIELQHGYNLIENENETDEEKDLISDQKID